MRSPTQKKRPIEPSLKIPIRSCGGKDLVLNVYQDITGESVPKVPALEFRNYPFINSVSAYTQEVDLGTQIALMVEQLRVAEERGLAIRVFSPPGGGKAAFALMVVGFHEMLGYEAAVDRVKQMDLEIIESDPVWVAVRSVLWPESLR